MYSPLTLILVPFLLSLVVIIILRRLDRESQNLTKVKRLIESLLSDFKEKVNEEDRKVIERLGELKEASNKSKMLGNYLKGQLEIVNTRVNDLQSADGFIAKLSRTGKSLEDLSVKVEGQISVLDESDTKLLVLREDMSRLVEEVDNAKSSYKELGGLMREESEGVIKELRDSYEKELLELREGVEDQAKETLLKFDERLVSTSESQNKRSQAIEEELNTIILSVDKLVDDFNNKHEEVQRRSSELTKEYKEREDEFEKNLTRLEQKYKDGLVDKFNGIEKRVNGFNIFFEDMDRVVREFELKFNTELSGQMSRLEEEMELKLDVLRGNISKAQREIEEKMVLPKEALTNELNKLKGTIEKDINALRNKVEDMDMKVLGLGSSLKDKFNKDIEQLIYTLEEEKRKITKQSTSINAYLENYIDTEKSRITKDLSLQVHKAFVEQKELERTLNVLKKEGEGIKRGFEESVSRFKEEVKHSDIELRGQISKSIEDLHFSFENQRRENEREYEGVKGSIEKMYLSVRERLISEANTISGVIEEKKSEINLFYESNKGELQEKEKELDYMISGIKEFYGAELDKMLQTIKTNYDKVEQEYMFNNKKLLKDTEEQVKEVSNELLLLQSKIKSMAEDSRYDVGEQANTYKRELSEHVNKLRVEVKETEVKKYEILVDKSENLSKELFSMEGKVKEMEDMALRGIGMYKEEVRYELEGLLEDFNKRLNGLNMELENKLAVKTEKAQSGMRSMLSSLQSEYEGKLNSYISKTEGRVKVLGTELKQVLGYDVDIEEFNKKFGLELSKMETELTSLKDKLSLKTKEEFEHVSMELKLIDERIRDFVKESKLFKKAEKFYDKLKEEIQNASEQTKRMREEREYFKEFDNKLEHVMDIKEQLKGVMSNADSKRKVLSELVDRTESVLNMEDVIEKKLKDMQTSLSGLEEGTKRLSRFKEIYNKASESISKLNESDARVKASLPVLKEAQEYISGLDGHIEEIKDDFKMFQDKNTVLKGTVEDIEKKMSKIEGLQEKMEEVIKRFDEMDLLVLDLEKRTNQIEIARERVSETENLLSKLQKAADRRIEELQVLVKGEVKAKGSKSKDDKRVFRKGVDGKAGIFEKGEVLEGGEDALDGLSKGIEVLDEVELASDIDLSDIEGRVEEGIEQREKREKREQNEKRKEDIKIDGSGNGLSSENRQEAVIKLYDKGFDIERISTLLNLSKSEVKLVIDVDKSKIR